MSEQPTKDLRVRATPSRIKILALLADNDGPLSWSELLIDGRSKSTPVWRAMQRAGWITAEFRDGDWWFAPTGDGYMLLEVLGK